MPKDEAMMTRPTRRPWWVGPGVGAVLGAVAIAVAAQGSLAGGRVQLPAGPSLSSTGASRSVGPVPQATAATPPEAESTDGTVVAPVHPVVTQSDGGTSTSAGASRPAAEVTSGGSGPSTTGGSAGESPSTATGDTTGSVRTGSTGGGSTDTVEPTTAVGAHSSTTSTTETGDH